MYGGPFRSVSRSSDGYDVNCFERGVRDGDEHPFIQDTYDECGDDYCEGFIKGCMSVEGNDREICESATDACYFLLYPESRRIVYTK